MKVCRTFHARHNTDKKPWNSGEGCKALYHAPTLIDGHLDHEVCMHRGNQGGRTARSKASGMGAQRSTIYDIDFAVNLVSSIYTLFCK